MSLILSGLQLAGSIFRTSLTTKVVPVRLICYSPVRFNTELNDSENNDEQKPTIDPAKDRTRAVPYETSVRYIKSSAYQQTYGSNPVWKLYRRNHKGGLPPRKTRKTCIRNGIITTGNPCPICRDEYLVIDYRNVDLLKQFISEHNGEIISYQKTGVCQRKHNHLLVAIMKAKDYGTISFDVPFRTYNYNEWKSEETEA